MPGATNNTPLKLKSTATIVQTHELVDKTVPSWWRSDPAIFFARYGSTYMRAVTTATCCEADVVASAWGHSCASASRALSVLTDHCTCPASYHEAVDS